MGELVRRDFRNRHAANRKQPFPSYYCPVVLKLDTLYHPRLIQKNGKIQISEARENGGVSGCLDTTPRLEWQPRATLVVVDFVTLDAHQERSAACRNESTEIQFTT